MSYTENINRSNTSSTHDKINTGQFYLTLFQDTASTTDFMRRPLWHGRLNMNLHGAVEAYLKYYGHMDRPNKNTKLPHNNLTGQIRTICSSNSNQTIYSYLISPIAEIFKNILGNINESP
jgi:hypothetical protein